MIKLRKSLLAALVAVSCSGALHAQTVDDIMEKHAKAIGGAENWNKVKTLKLTGALSNQGMDINITQTIAMGKAMRIDISVMGMSGYQIVTNKEGYMYMPFQGAAKVDTMKPEMVKMFQPQLDVKGNQMLDYKTTGTRGEFLGVDTVENKPCYKIRFTDKDSGVSVSFFEIATYYLLRSERKMKQDDQEMDVAIIYNDYKKQDEGIVMPMAVTAQGGAITFKKIEVNKPVDDTIFIPTTGK